jgi:glycosyltransferase involved in cell wall biosynthesis
MATEESRSVRVAHLTSVHPWDDTRIFHRMCRALADDGFDVHLVAPCDNPPPASDTAGITLHAVPRGTGNRLRRCTQTVNAVFRKALELDARLYHFHDPELLPVGAELARRGKRVIYDVHEDLPATIVDKPWLPKLAGRFLAGPVSHIERSWARRMTAVIGAEEAITERFQDLVPLAISVQNFPRLADFPAPSGTDYKREQGLLVSFGGLNGHRCADRILAGLSQLTGALDYRLVIAGRSFGPAFETPLQSLPAFQRMNFVGRVGHDEMKSYLYRAQLAFVMYSPSPNHLRVRSNRFFEAMSAGVPVITSDFPHWRQMVESIGCGLPVSPRDPAAIAAAVQWLLSHPAEAAAMGKRGRLAVEQRYSWEQEQQRLLALYRELLPIPARIQAPHVDAPALLSSRLRTTTTTVTSNGLAPLVRDGAGEPIVLETTSH